MSTGFHEGGDGADTYGPGDVARVRTALTDALEHNLGDCINVNPSTFAGRGILSGRPPMSELEHSRSTVGTTDDDWLSQQMGTDVCVWCNRRLSPAEIAACEAPDGIGRCSER